MRNISFFLFFLEVLKIRKMTWNFFSDAEKKVKKRKYRNSNFPLDKKPYTNV